MPRKSRNGNGEPESKLAARNKGPIANVSRLVRRSPGRRRHSSASRYVRVNAAPM
jgi:hypothetical protein